MPASLAGWHERQHEFEFSPTISEVYMAQHGSLHGAENSGEPNDRSPQQNSVDDLPGHHHFGPAPPDGGVDESRVCLLDTACTACMHSRRWRLAYEKTLPSGMVCSATSATKTFHVANGATTEQRAVVWKIPIFLQGHVGEVYSAEIEDAACSTPLLLSISAMTALDMVLHVRQKLVVVNSLNITVPMLITKTKHLAIEVCYIESSSSMASKTMTFLDLFASQRSKILWSTSSRKARCRFSPS